MFTCLEFDPLDLTPVPPASLNKGFTGAAKRISWDLMEVSDISQITFLQSNSYRNQAKYTNAPRKQQQTGRFLLIFHDISIKQRHT